MDKNEFLEQVYNSSFQGELEKISINLNGLRKISPAIRKKTISRYLNIPAYHSSGVISTIKNSDTAVSPVGISHMSAKRDSDKLMNALGLPSVKMDKNLHGKIINPPKGAVGFIKSERPGLFKRLKTKKDKEMFNRLVNVHEMQESKVKKLMTYSGHNSPDVITAESNMIRSLPEKGNSNIKGIFKEMRSLSEAPYINKYYPGFEYGKTKLSPAAKKHIRRSYEKDYNESLNNSIDYFNKSKDKRTIKKFG